MLTLWVDKYRPVTIADYVWASSDLKTNVDKWLSEGAVANVLFSGGAGRGKTTLARLLVRELGIPDTDVLDINASLERRVEGFTETITAFTSTWAFGERQMKYVILDEADRLSTLSQDFLRNEIERHSSTCRFILTCNNRRKITAPLHSRLQEFEFSALDREESILRMADMLVKEGVVFEPETLIRYVDAYHPDLRKCINVLQQKSTMKQLQGFDNGVASVDEFLIEILAALVSGDSATARQIITNKANTDDYIAIFRFIFTNIELFNGRDIQDSILIAIRDGMWRHSAVADTEINMAATMTEVAQIARK